MRPSAYAALGFGSLFNYCTQALRLSEDAAYNRMVAARACRRFPVILERLASGAMSLTSIRLLEPHLTPENCQAVLAKAANRTRRQIEALVAELAPRPDASAYVRGLAVPAATAPLTPVEDRPVGLALNSQSVETRPDPGPSPAPFLATPRPIVQASAPQRYRVQFTIGEEAHDDLRHLQTLSRREIPDGDPGLIVARALRLLRVKVDREKLGSCTRSGTGRNVARRVPSRRIPASVKRAVWDRDAGQCAFLSAAGQRCPERAFLEFHHVQPYAMEGPATVPNISLRCRRHNQYEAELFFGSAPIPPRRAAAPPARS
jgi:hypothetical protein